MPRIARKSIETPFLHVMVQGVNKEYIFNNDEYIKMYLELIEKNPCGFPLVILYVSLSSELESGSNVW